MTTRTYRVRDSNWKFSILKRENGRKAMFAEIISKSQRNISILRLNTCHHHNHKTPKYSKGYFKNSIYRHHSEILEPQEHKENTTKTLLFRSKKFFFKSSEIQASENLALTDDLLKKHYRMYSKQGTNEHSQRSGI